MFWLLLLQHGLSYYYYACNKNHIQVEGKTQFYESFLQDQKEITLKWWDWLEGKEDYGKKTKRYCQTTAVSSDKKFLASLDKIMKKEKKNMDAAYAGDPTYQKYASLLNTLENQKTDLGRFA